MCSGSSHSISKNKRTMKKYTILIFLMLMISCKEDRKVAEVTEKGSDQTLADLTQPLPELSIYHLPGTWTTQDGADIQLEELRGKVLVMVMIYTSCKAACPRLVADMRNIERQVAEKDLDKLKFIMVSIDPETDTPAQLKKFAKENKMKADHWLFLRGTPEDTREFAAVLAVSYKKISPIDFSHSNIISVFDEEGVLVHQQEGLGVDNQETIEAIHTEVRN